MDLDGSAVVLQGTAGHDHTATADLADGGIKLPLVVFSSAEVAACVGTDINNAEVNEGELIVHVDMLPMGCDTEWSMKQRYGITVPFFGPLHAQRDRFVELESLGYTDVWTAESDSTDGLTPLALASVWAPSLRLGTAILPAYTRGPALLAQSAASMASAAPGRFVLGLGSSSNVIVESWNDVTFDQPYKRVRDTIRFLRTAFAGGKVTQQYDTFSVRGFRLGVKLEQPVPIFVAALREQMLRLAGREADGAIINWLSPDDARRVSGIVRAENPDAEVVARIFVMFTEDRETALNMGRFVLAAYINVPVYKAFHQWLGRSDVLGEHWEQWDAGDRRGSLQKIPEQVVDDLLVHGSVDHCRDRLKSFEDNGVTCTVPALVPVGDSDPFDGVRALAPLARP